ncbi:hypothetical protein HBB16_01685 [Pseudonocardia sp. MCCB 268]|nr:hypothetical protein [Pseudonocardia cytotoxica]
MGRHRWRGRVINQWALRPEPAGARSRWPPVANLVLGIVLTSSRACSPPCRHRSRAGLSAGPVPDRRLRAEYRCPG